jgi:hypothetical protein
MADPAPSWKNSRIASHGRDVAFLSSFLVLTAVPLTALVILRKYFDEPLLWAALSFIDEIGTVVIFTMFWAAIILRLFAEIRSPRGV